MMIPLPDGPISRVAISSQAYGILKKAIIRGELKAGSRLLEEPLCQSLGISRSPLREAIRLLQADRLVEETGKGGVVVTQVLFDELPPRMPPGRPLRTGSVNLWSEPAERPRVSGA